MKKITNNLRKRTSKKNPNKEDIAKINSKQSKIFEKLASSKKTVVSSTVPKEDLPVVYKEENVAPLKVTYESVDYTFFIEYTEEVDLSKEWLKISVLDDENHEYLVKINNNFNVFGKIKVSDRELIQTFVMIITLAQLSSVRLGYKESYKFVEKMNEIIKLLE